MKEKNLVGQRFGRLTVIAFNRKEKSVQYWLCRCDCGNEKVVRGHHLTGGNTRSCGCLRLEVLRHKHEPKHGMSHSRIYNIWRSIIKRCELKTDKDFPRYGGRGIAICTDWHAFNSFKDWAFSNGYREDLSIDRIDVNGNYEPSNCRWVDAKAQAQNRRSNHWLTFNGETLCISDWAKRLNTSTTTLLERIHRGWSIKDVVTKPVRRMRRG